MKALPVFFVVLIGSASAFAAEESCISKGCHDALVKAPVTHAGVTEGACDTCHKGAKDATPYKNGPKHKFEKVAVPGGCVECHEAPAGKSLHRPAKEGKCLECHNPHASKFASLLKKAPMDLCAKCHAKVMKGVGPEHVVHGAIASDKGCVNCHVGHASKESKLLKKPVKELCLSCHSKEIKSEGRTIANIDAELNEKGAKAHGPVADGDCLACHTPHVAGYANLLGKPFVSDWYGLPKADAYALCFDCHDSGVLAGAETKDGTGFRNGTKNLHFAHVMAEPRGRSCVACHEVHAGTAEHFVAKTVSFFGFRVPLNFKPTPSGGSCTPACHELKAYDRNKN